MIGTMTGMRRRPRSASALILTLLCTALAAGTTTSPAAQSAPVGSACDAHPKTANLNFTLKDMSGANVSLSSFAGKVLILDFWATWCSPCKEEIPEFIALQKRYGTRGLQVIGVSVDDSPAKMRAYAAELQVNYPLLDGRKADDLMKAFAPITKIPTAFVIGPDGAICRKHSGFASPETFEREVTALF